MALAWSCTKAEAKRRCSYREFIEWAAYDRIDPIGEIRGDLRMAVLATVIARSAGSKTARPDHFIPDFTKGIRKQSPQEIMAKFDKYTKGLGRV